jgi:hypothetical protein
MLSECVSERLVQFELLAAFAAFCGHLSPKNKKIFFSLEGLGCVCVWKIKYMYVNLRQHVYMYI